MSASALELTQEQLQHFEDKGYLLINSLLSGEQLEAAKVELEKLKTDQEEKIRATAKKIRKEYKGRAGGGEEEVVQALQDDKLIIEMGSLSIRSIFAVHESNAFFRRIM
eukprot:CAMPEP_0174274978 /NCGR_PEP_ID=MMETSP0439-20130205/59577_1 /TAXON_ID=0 /ORGANISM="Stereomyxa ramosa, Strain Chinc5" /LENGTH=108 /DNA_ID=CAMNT_0015367047 /DNA_START=598 /DNA_END=924 /DNA_ORIENTATION=-